MKWNMFIDDERFPADDGKDWVICRTKMQVISAIFDHDKIAPSFISFDHDLGENEQTGYDIAKWIVEADMDGIISIPINFQFYVHSQNPIGKQNIETYLNNYLKIRKDL
jgi:hypothetical protein